MRVARRTCRNENICAQRQMGDSKDAPPSLPNAILAASGSLGTVRGRDLMDDVSDRLVGERCRVGGGRSHTSSTCQSPKARWERELVTEPNPSVV